MASRAVVLSAPDPAAGYCQPMPPLETPGHSQAILAQSLVVTSCKRIYATRSTSQVYCSQSHCPIKFINGKVWHQAEISELSNFSAFLKMVFPFTQHRQV